MLRLLRQIQIGLVDQIDAVFYSYRRLRYQNRPSSPNLIEPIIVSLRKTIEILY